MDIDAEGTVPLLRGDVLDFLVSALEGGVVDKNVELTELGDAALDDAPAVLLVRDVAGDEHDGRPACSTQRAVSRASSSSSGR